MYFDNNKFGVIMFRIVNDLMDIIEFVYYGFEDLFIFIVMLVGLFFIFIDINIFFMFIIFVILLFIIWFVIVKKDKMNIVFMKSRVIIGDVNVILENSIVGMKVIKFFCIEKEELNKFVRSNKLFRRVR